MTIEIPVWLLWTLGIGVGIPAVCFVLFFAVIGWKLRNIFG